MIRLSELRYKEVINECTCKRLGCIEDLEFDEKCGQICAVIIPRSEERRVGKEC